MKFVKITGCAASFLTSLLGAVIMMRLLAYCMKTLTKFDKTVFYILLVPSFFIFFSFPLTLPSNDNNIIIITAS